MIVAGRHIYMADLCTSKCLEAVKALGVLLKQSLVHTDSTYEVL
jgi:hypothetical protein